MQFEFGTRLLARPKLVGSQLQFLAFAKTRAWWQMGWSWRRWSKIDIQTLAVKQSSELDKRDCKICKLLLRRIFLTHDHQESWLCIAFQSSWSWNKIPILDRDCMHADLRYCLQHRQPNRHQRCWWNWLQTKLRQMTFVRSTLQPCCKLGELFSVVELISWQLVVFVVFFKLELVW